MANLRSILSCFGNIDLMSIGFPLHADFKKMSCRPVQFKGHGPLISQVVSMYGLQTPGTVPYPPGY